MLILAADTSGRNGSLALAKCEPNGCDVLEVVSLEGGTFSAQLVPQISNLLGKHGFAKNDLDAFSVAAGPGSFTGLRVGLAAIKALAEILQKPIAAICLLEAVARAASRGGKILAALDAGRGQIYCGRYDICNPGAKQILQELCTETEFVSRAKAWAADGGTVATPDARIEDVARGKNLAISVIAPPRADAIARLGAEKILSGDVVSPEALDATYIRRSDAEVMKGVVA